MQERAASTRQAVLQGAAASFEKFGYGTASLSTIIAHAGVSKGAMYFHFSSKEDLAQAVIDAQLAMAASASTLIIEQTPKALDALILVSKELGRQLQTESIARGGMRLTLESAIVGSPNAQAFEEWVGKMGDLAARAQAEGDIVDGMDALTLGRYIVASFTGVQTVSEMLTGRADLQQRLTEMWQMLLPAVVPRRRLPRVMAVAEDALIDWSDR
ncbi:TetR family transcriptional regulator [Rhodococcus sp. 06-462-5]|uniref:ScbR family autoregulator-binding transcription factor n=1 Tax=unclassified Rhodococcus (in: high G+C Gram-positive bacteria) TaxID=192944 RepID=UPI000B9B36FB|nr:MULTISPECIES: ScbR family autoregulator-binding transcription factor [unclassified Rhodococcus (in: high G+C Gram-positive bacteria)]OZC76017.1 TetR family transcriptional regulator [Rhodococcus sp. 06-462-5]OZE69991.1 TetR family transcriptional regulator [Rhodococcus sp. 02-925g]